MITRHPFDRLVSAFRNKFDTEHKTEYQYSRGRLIARNGLKHFLGPSYKFNLNMLVVDLGEYIIMFKYYIMVWYDARDCKTRI